MIVNELIDYLGTTSNDSKFHAKLCNDGGFLTFSNSGQRGERKFFSIGIVSIIKVLEDINKNLEKFEGSTNYVEKEWRDLGSTYYSDEVAKALSTVQTKPLFSTLSKLIRWANSPKLDNIDSDHEIVLKEKNLLKTIKKLKKVSTEFSPKNKVLKTSTSFILENISTKTFYEAVSSADLIIIEEICYSFLSSLCTKPFVILTGLSGSGKTKLAQAFSSWICEDEEQVCLVPVGADWTNREPLLGYPNALNSGEYVKPDNKVIDLLLNAKGNPNKPYFLILDEMNLSHVERYFADFLSAMESGQAIPLHVGPNSWGDVPSSICLPKNLFMIGTVNVDETTYMFSPKVLDRANVIDFRVSIQEMISFLENPAKPDMESLKFKGAGMAASFIDIATGETPDSPQKDAVNKALMSFFDELNKVGAEFGYRTAMEIHRFTALLHKLTTADGAVWESDKIIDAAIIQKLLPKVHGSRNKLVPVLTSLAESCLLDTVQDKGKLLKGLEEEPEKIQNTQDVRFKQSLGKILRMRRRVINDGFTSFAEA